MENHCWVSHKHLSGGTALPLPPIGEVLGVGDKEGNQ